MSPIFFSAASLMISIFYLFIYFKTLLVPKKTIFSPVMKENKVHRVSLSILKLFRSRPNTSLGFSMCVALVFHTSQYPRHGVCHRPVLKFRVPGSRVQGPRVTGSRIQGTRLQDPGPEPRTEGTKFNGPRPLGANGPQVLVLGPGSKGPVFRSRVQGQRPRLKDGRPHGLSLPRQHFLAAVISLQYSPKFFSQ